MNLVYNRRYIGNIYQNTSLRLSLVHASRAHCNLCEYICVCKVDAAPLTKKYVVKEIIAQQMDLF